MELLHTQYSKTVLMMIAIVPWKSVFATYHLYMSKLVLFLIHLILHFEISAAIIFTMGARC